LCFAVAYDEKITDVERIEKVEERLLMTPLRLVVVSATSLDRIDLGEVKIEESK